VVFLSSFTRAIRGIGAAALPIYFTDDERGRFSEKRVARQAGIWIRDRNLVSVWSLPMSSKQTRHIMNQLIYIIGLIVVVMAVLSLLGLR